MDIWWPLGANMFPSPPPAGSRGRRFPGVGYGYIPASHDDYMHRPPQIAFTKRPWAFSKQPCPVRSLLQVRLL
eukprot:9489565-Pyramimonas_sp.AAC.1